MNNNTLLENQILELLDGAFFSFSDIKPSIWAEQNRIMTSDVSPFPGKFSYDKVPYLREIVDCASPFHPAKRIAVMKGAQLGFSTGVIEAAIGWIISQSPGNILFLTGHADLAEEAMNGKIDQMIDSCGLRPLIRPNVLRARNMRTGDTNKSKEFPGGSLVSGSAGNHKLLRQRSVKYGFIDDFDAAKRSSSESGSTTKMIEQRFAAYGDKMKLYYISTPEKKSVSNIEPVYLLGDQRKYMIPCPCCGEFINLEWEIDVDDNKAGITWSLDANGNLKDNMIGYICQKCAGFFTDSAKYEFNINGFWEPTANPSQPGYYSYHLSSLYAPVGMFDWNHYVRQYIEANPPGKDRSESLQQTFVNLCLGQTYEEQKKSPKANTLQMNIRNYDIGKIPEKLSLKDGNGKIVLITCAADLNGVEDDARLDWEIWAWSETGASYAIDQGSIGTFVPRENSKTIKEDRERWNYYHSKHNSVWTFFDSILEQTLETDTGRRMRIMITGIDTGHYTERAYEYMDKTNNFVIGLKGERDGKARAFGVDTRKFRPAKERNNLFILEVNQLKDELATAIELKWDSGNDIYQSYGFMNFPLPGSGKYLFQNYFSHYEAEHRVIETKGGEGVAARWVKKNFSVQNHFWDVRVYNMALRDIFVYNITKENGIQNGAWADYIDIINGL